MTNTNQPLSTNERVSDTLASTWADIHAQQAHVIHATELVATPDPKPAQEQPIIEIPVSSILIDHHDVDPPEVYQETNITSNDQQYATLPPLAHVAQRTYRGRPVKAKNAHLPDHILAFKERRKTGTVLSTWTAGAVGLFFFGPIGAAGGAGVAYGISKTVGKVRERKLIRRYEQST